MVLKENAPPPSYTADTSSKKSILGASSFGKPSSNSAMFNPFATALQSYEGTTEVSKTESKLDENNSWKTAFAPQQIVEKPVVQGQPKLGNCYEIYLTIYISYMPLQVL